MIVRRFLPLCLLAVFVWPAFADEDLPPDAKKIVEENEKASEAILQKAEDALKKAQEEHAKAAVEVKDRKEKVIAQLEALAKRLEKEGKIKQAQAVAEQAEELKTGRLAGAQPDPGTLAGLRGMEGKVFTFQVTGAIAGTVW